MLLRKPTSTKRFIPADVYLSDQQKAAAFHHKMHSLNTVSYGTMFFGVHNPKSY